MTGARITIAVIISFERLIKPQWSVGQALVGQAGWKEQPIQQLTVRKQNHVLKKKLILKDRKIFYEFMNSLLTISQRQQYKTLINSAK
jgi:hypothetical protein